MFHFELRGIITHDHRTVRFCSDHNAALLQATFSSIADAIASSHTDKSLPKAPLIGLGGSVPPLDATVGLAIPERAEVSRQSIPPQQFNETLTTLAKERGGAFNWNESIVDLMKLLHLQSNLQALQQLAQELDYPADKDGSPEMTDWLHSEVIAKLTGASVRPSNAASAAPAAMQAPSQPQATLDSARFCRENERSFKAQ